MKILKTLAVATPLAISALAITGCHSNDNNKVSQSVSKDYSSMPIEQKYNAKSEEKIDNNTPNIPRRVNSDIIQYRNLSGKLVDVKIVDDATISLYSAIHKHSTKNSPEIKDIGGFYTDVESNISKAQLDESNDWAVKSRIYDVTSQAVVALRQL